MITKNIPKGENKEAVKLSKFFSDEDNIVYPIQSDLQRRYCWPAAYVDKFFKDYIIGLYEKNKDADERGEDGFFAKIGDAILTRVEENYGPEGKCRKQEIIDMSQRITTIQALVAVMLYLHMRNNNINDEEERRKLYNKYIKTKNGLSYKIISTFNDSDFEKVIEGCIKNTIKTDDKAIKKSTKCFNEKAKKNEVVYKSFESICALIYELIDSTIGVDCETIKERLDLFLDKTYIQIEECNKEERVEKFREVNSYRLGIANKDIYKTIICSKGDRIDSKFQEFEAMVDMLKDPKRINILKTPITVTEYIMKIALIVMDKTRETCSCSFSLEDEKNGLEYQLNNGFLNTEEKIIEYLDVCIDICDFLFKSMEYKQDKFNEEWYLLTENRTKPFIWLYNILPAYAIYKLKNEDKKTFAFEMLLKSFTVYSVKYAVNRSVQYIQTYMYNFAKEVLENSGDECSLEDFETVILSIYNKTFRTFISTDFTKTVKGLTYGQASSKSGIYGVLSCLEYLAQKKCGVKRDNLYKLVKKNKNEEIEIDHIFPKSLINERNERYIDSIGNLVFLEKTLNASKQDNSDATSDKYSDSSFITTKLIIDGNRYEALTNEQLDSVRNDVIPFHADSTIINNFEERILDRENGIAYKIKQFVS